MTTAQDLVDAVRPCLPLPGVRDVTMLRGVSDIVCLAEHSDGMGGLMYVSQSIRDAEQRIIGAIWQACAERGWDIDTLGGAVCIQCDHNALGICSGTDAIALCRAYAAACEAGKGATDA